jgi:hypothetical protein
MGVNRLPATGLVAKAQAIHDKLDGNAEFPTPVPSLADFQKHIDELAAANAAVDANGGKAEHLAKFVAMKQVLADIKSLCGYVQATSGGDADLILSTGFEVVKRGGPIGELNPPTKLVSKFTTMEGRAAIQWKREDGADLYHVYMSRTNNPFTWELIGATTKSRFNADSLEPATIYWFSVTAIGAAGESSKSEPLMARAA